MTDAESDGELHAAKVPHCVKARALPILLLIGALLRSAGAPVCGYMQLGEVENLARLI